MVTGGGVPKLMFNRLKSRDRSDSEYAVKQMPAVLEINSMNCQSWHDLTTSKHPFAAIVKVTDNCNMECTYCYVDRDANLSPMTYETLEATIKGICRLTQRRRRTHFIWHGGEPMLLGREFFTQVVSLQDNYCRAMSFENCIQTNGTLLTRDVIEFFIANKFSISLSLDGPQEIHDPNRRLRSGSGTFHRVTRVVELLHEYGLTVGAVVVMTKQTLPMINELYAFMKSMRLQYRINPIIQSLSNRDHFDSVAVSPEEYGTAMCELFDLWFHDDEPMQIDPIDIIVGNLVSDVSWGCDYTGGCLRDIICVNPDGGVFPCGQMAGNNEFLLGDIVTDPIESIVSSPTYARVRERNKKTLACCKDCEFVNICHSGCMVSAMMRGGTIFAPDYFCVGRKMLFSHIRDRLDREVQRVSEMLQPANGRLQGV